jgi:hypothetical protein
MDWKHERLIWADGPFRLLPRVFKRIFSEPCRVIICLHRLNETSFSAAFQRAHRSMKLPHEPLFLRYNQYLLPPPPFPVYILFFDLSPPPASVFTARLLCSGDIEQNPGPDPARPGPPANLIPFLPFITTFSNDCVSSLSDTSCITTRKIELQYRSQQWPPNFHLQLIDHFSGPPEEAMRLIATYETYSSTSLQFRAGTFY